MSHSNTAASQIEAGNWLRALRLSWRITRMELAEQTGFGTAEIVAGIEAGQVRLPRAAYAAFARVFALDAASFAASCDAYYAAAAEKIRSAA